MEGLHKTITRHSFSAPSSLAVSLIAGCSDSLSKLSGRVADLTRKSRDSVQVRESLLLGLSVQGSRQYSLSTGDLSKVQHSALVIAEELIDEVLKMALDPTKPRSKPFCHHCHAPRSDPTHVGISCGVGICPLEHWEGCEGGIPGGKDAKGKMWTACPNLLTSDSETDDDLENETRKKKEFIDDKNGQQLPGTMKEAAEIMEESLLDKHQQKQTEVSDSDSDSSSSEDEELRQQREEYERFQMEVEKQAQSSKAAAKAAKRDAKQRRIAQEKADLASKMKNLKLKQASIITPSRQASHLGNVSTSGDNLKEKVSEHEAKKQKKAADKRAKLQLQQSDGLTIGGIRSLPDVRQEVEGYISRLQSIVPSLASDPTAGGFGSSTFQPEGVYAGNVRNSFPEKTNKNYVYVAELGQVVPMVRTLGDLPSAATSSSRPVPSLPSDSSESESECSEDEDCELEPAPGMRFSWKKHNDGRKFFKQVPVKAKSPEMIVTYQLDKDTGNYEKVLVAKQVKGSKLVKSKEPPSTTPRYRDHRVTASAPRAVKSQARKEERLPTFVSGAEPEKQGKESRVPSLVQFARDCPVSWTSKVTTAGLNPVLFSWAYIAELLATRTAQSPALEEGELEARLQHFLSVLEVTLQTTTQTDFASDSWKIARLYHQKVQDKVDSGVYSWLGLAKQWGTATLPHELMAANAETAPRGKKSPKRRGDKDKDATPLTGLCYSWNTSDTKGKCKWEIDNEGKKCNKQHHCSWCKSENGQTNYHQKTFCRKRQDKEGE